MLAGAHFREGRKPSLLVLDPQAERKGEVFFARHPGAGKLAPIAFETAAADQPALLGQTLDKAAAAHGAPTAIIVDLEAADRALPAALAIEDHYRRKGEIAPPIYIRAWSVDPQATDPCSLLIGFGGARDLAEPEALLQEDLDTLARSIHEFYYEGRLDEGDVIGSRASMHEWDMLPEAVRDDNRLVADCFGLKLRDVGLQLASSAGSDGGGAMFTAEELEALSRAEHDRWMAAKLIDGWVFGETRDDARKLHPDIIPYDNLSEARKDLDREQIRIIGRLIGRTGKRALRNLTLAIDDGAGQGAAAGMARILAELKVRYPDRAPVLVGAFEDAGVRAALQAGIENGAVARASLSRNAQATLDTIPRDQRAAAARLLRNADRVYALPEERWPADRRQAYVRAQAQLRIGGPAAAADPDVIAVDPDGRLIAAPWTR